MITLSPTLLERNFSKSWRSGREMNVTACLSVVDDKEEISRFKKKRVERGMFFKHLRFWNAESAKHAKLCFASALGMFGKGMFSPRFFRRQMLKLEG